MGQVTIESARIGKPPRTFTDGLISDNGIEFLDRWIYPDKHYDELDVDEFEQAVKAGKLTLDYEMNTRLTFIRLKAEIVKRNFPDDYIGK
jgi:predicted RNA-binding protein associated with RNAse of E/G family